MTARNTAKLRAPVTTDPIRNEVVSTSVGCGIAMALGARRLLCTTTLFSPPITITTPSSQSRIHRKLHRGATPDGSPWRSKAQSQLGGILREHLRGRRGQWPSTVVQRERVAPPLQGGARDAAGGGPRGRHSRRSAAKLAARLENQAVDTKLEPQLRIEWDCASQVHRFLWCSPLYIHLDEQIAFDHWMLDNVVPLPCVCAVELAICHWTTFFSSP
jgi:hypothetical protein